MIPTNNNNDAAAVYGILGLNISNGNDVMQQNTRHDTHGMEG